MVPGHVTFGQTAGCTYAGIGTGTATITCDDAGNVYPTGITTYGYNDSGIYVYDTVGNVVISGSPMSFPAPRASSPPPST
jgi:hypothetical protein